MRRKGIAGLAAVVLLLAACGAQPAALMPQPSHAALHIVATLRASVRLAPAAPVQATAIDMVSPRLGFALGTTAGGGGRTWLLTTRDGGRRWTVGVPLSDASSLQFLDPQDGFVLTSAGLQGTTDGGKRWLTLDRRSFAAVRFASPSDGVAINARQELLHTTDGGRTWTLAEVQAGLSFTSVSAVSGPYYFALAAGAGARANTSVLLQSQDGVHWTTLFRGITSPALHSAYLAYLGREFSGRHLTAPPTFGQGGQVVFTSPKTGWVSLLDGGYTATMVAHTDDGGRTFRFAWGNSGCAMGCNAMGGGLYPATFLGAQMSWRYSGQELQRSLDGGRSFSSGGPLALTLAANQGVRQTQFLTRAFGFAATMAGILRTTDGGASWQRVWPKTPGPLTAAAFGRGDFGVAVSQAQLGVIWRTTDGGRSWRRVYDLPGGGYQVNGLWAFGDHQSLALTEPGGEIELWATRDGGLQWTRQRLHLPPVPPYSTPDLWFGSLNDGWLTASNLSQRVFYVTRDGGRTWTREPKSAALSNVAACAPLPGGNGWCVGSELYASANGGRSFVGAGFLPGLVSGSGLGFRSLAGGAVFSGNSVYVTADAGRSFMRIVLPQDIFVESVQFLSPEVLYVVTGDGRLLQTRDGGRKWRQIV